MGSVDLEYIFSSSEEVVDDAYEVSAMPVRRQLSAMRVGYASSSSKDLVYLEEVPIDFFLVPCAITDVNSETYRWLRFEVIINNTCKSVARHHELVIAEHPYALKRVHHAAFKRGAIHGRPEPDSAFASLEEALQWTNSLDHDYFYTHKGLIAALSEPQGVLQETDARAPKNALFVFGICESFQQCEQALFQTETARQLLAQTENQTIKFAPSKHYNLPPVLPEELAREAYSLMFIAIRQALAGPHQHSEDWIGRPVTDKINHIYRDHLFNGWRRYRSNASSTRYVEPQELEMLSAEV